MLTGQPVALVSDIAGTTTDPVSKAMEILPIGPVMIIDTAGVDDVSELGPLRIAKTKELLPKINMAIYVLKTDEAPTEADVDWLKRLQALKIPMLLVLNEVNGHGGDSYMAESEPVLGTFGLTYIGADLLTNKNRLPFWNCLANYSQKMVKMDRLCWKALWSRTIASCSYVLSTPQRRRAV